MKIPLCFVGKLAHRVQEAAIYLEGSGEMRASGNSQEKPEQSIVYRCDQRQSDGLKPQRVNYRPVKGLHSGFGGIR